MMTIRSYDKITLSQYYIIQHCIFCSILSSLLMLETRLYLTLSVRFCLLLSRQKLSIKFTAIVLDLDKKVFIAFFHIKKYLLSPLNISTLLKFFTYFYNQTTKIQWYQQSNYKFGKEKTNSL